MKKLSGIAMVFFIISGFVYSSDALIINNIEIIYTGKERTGEKTLRSYLDIEEGQSFENREDFEEALDSQQKILNNTRYFKAVEITAEQSEENAEITNVLISIEDGLTFVPIPYPLPDSAVGKNGWSFGLEVNYDNFFGTMTDFYFDGYANIAFGEEEKLKAWKLTPKLRNIKVGGLKFALEYMQEYGTTEVTDPARAEGLQTLQHYTNHQSFLKVGTSINLAGNWSYSFSPQIGLRYGYDYYNSFDGDAVQENDEVIEDRLNFIFGHTIGLGEVNWVGSLRKGYGVSLSNSLKLLSSYDNSTDVEQLRFVTDFNLAAKWYVPLGSRFNYYTKFEALYIINSIDTGLGGRLRGVQNSSMFGDLGFFWKNTMGFEIWGNKTLHIQIHPFADLGIAFNTKAENSFIDNFRFGFGTELVVMLGSIDLKGKYGYDVISDYHDFSFSTGFSY